MGGHFKSSSSSSSQVRNANRRPPQSPCQHKRYLPIQSGRQRFGEFLGEIKVSITRIVGRVVFAALVDNGRRDIVAAAPDEDLVLTILVDCFLLVQSLERSVVAFIQLPGLGYRDPHEASLLKNVPQSANGTLQEGGEGNIGDKTFGLDEISGFDHFFMTLWAEGAIVPEARRCLEE